MAQAFRQQQLDNPNLDARVLIGHALGLDHSALIAAADRALNPEEAGRIAAAASRRLAHEPVARIIGEKEFWGLSLKLNDATLVPRPETETVVEAALAGFADGDKNRDLVIADLGTGSGALLVALLTELPQARGIGTDISVSALKLARENAARHRVADRTWFVACDFGTAFSGGFDLLVSNPPYIRSGDIAGLAPEVRRYEPRIALDGGEGGIAGYRAILGDAARLLKPGGCLVVEIGAGQADTVMPLFEAAGLVCGPSHPDLSGITRALTARCPA
jgi:release factor glutamine methyltransferase